MLMVSWLFTPMCVSRASSSWALQERGLFTPGEGGAGPGLTCSRPHPLQWTSFLQRQALPHEVSTASTKSATTWEAAVKNKPVGIVYIQTVTAGPNIWTSQCIFFPPPYNSVVQFQEGRGMVAHDSHISPLALVGRD